MPYAEFPRLTPAECVAAAGVDMKVGLSKAEVEQRRKKYGKNGLPDEPPKSLISLIIEQFEDTMVRLLLLAAVVSFILAIFEDDEDEKLTAYIEPLVIMTILVLNATVGVTQELNADEALKALLQLSAPKCVVIREGVTHDLAAEELVPGDVVVVRVGDNVPADCRVIEVNSTTIRADQANLTGESMSIIKHQQPLEMKIGQKQFFTNMLYSSTCITYGSAKAIVTQTGLDTEFGKVYTGTKETEEEKTPLQCKLDVFGEQLTKVISVICLLVWVVNIGNFTSKGSWMKGCIFFAKQGVALAVAALPEGLPAVVTTCLALGTRRMAEKNALVRKLPSVETLGCCTVICSDKTGTLTTNKMVVRRVVTFDGNNTQVYTVRGTTFNPVETKNWTGEEVAPKELVQLGGVGHDAPLTQDKALRDVAAVSALCNEAKLQYNAETQEAERVNEAMEAALLVAVEKLGLPDAAKSSALQGERDPTKRLLACTKHWQNDVYTRNGTLEFTRERKSMSVHVSSTGGDELLVKGAPDMLLKRCVSVKTAAGVVKKLTDEDRAAILATYKELASGAETLRCLGMATKKVGAYKTLEGVENPDQFAAIESDLTFVGFVGILDPPRPEVKHAIHQCADAHVRVVVITGGMEGTMPIMQSNARANDAQPHRQQGHG